MWNIEQRRKEELRSNGNSVWQIGAAENSAGASR